MVKLLSILLDCLISLLYFAVGVWTWWIGKIYDWKIFTR